MTASTVPARHGALLSLENAAIDELGKAFDGELVRPTDEAYDRARRPWNGMIDRRPALVVRPRGTADVVAAIRFARKHGLEVAVRCGGHGVSGQSVTDGGIVIDLGLMRAVRVDPTARRAWVQGGCLLSDVDRESQLHGLATTGGVVSHTGVGGLTLGGGYGYLSRRFGLASDNVRSAEVVTAAGDVLVASPDQNEDLFWGIRGGGGNFGVVTGFEFRLHPFGPDILSVDLAYPLENGPVAIRALLALAEDAPDALTVGGFMPRLRAAGEPLLELVEVLPYVQLQRVADEAQRPGLRQYARSHFIRATPDAFIEAFLTRGGQDPKVAANGSLGHLGGAVARSGPEEGAFSGRDALLDLVVGSTWEDPTHDADRLSAARAFGDSLAPLSTGRSYVNAIDGNETDKVRAAFGASTYDRLAAVKDRYDPDNVFNLNQNVRPSGA